MSQAHHSTHYNAAHFLADNVRVVGLPISSYSHALVQLLAAHAPDEYYLIESSNPKVQGLDGAVASFVEYLYALA